MADNTTDLWPAFKDFLRTLYRFSPFRAVFYLLVMVATELTQGISLLMIIPILSLTGITGDPQQSSGVVRFVLSIYQRSGMNLTLVNVLIVYIVAVSLAALLKRQQSVMMNAHFRESFIAHMRNRVYAAMTHADWEFYTSKRNSDVTALLTTEINCVGNSIHFFLTAASCLVLIIVNLSVSFMLSPTMSALALTTALVIFFALVPWHKKVSKTGEAARLWRQSMFSNILEHLGGMKLSKSSGKESQHIAQFERMSEGLLTEAVSFSRINANSHMIHTICAVFALSILCFSAIDVLNIETGLLLILIYIFAQTIPRFSILQRNIHYFIHALPSFAAVTAFEKECDANRERLSHQNDNDRLTLDREIAVKDVTFQYARAGRPVVEQLSITFQAKKTTAIIGPSGAGKSTLADLLLGLLTPRHGFVSIDDTPLDSSTIPAWRNSISYVPQECFLLHDTIRSNLLWACPDCDEAEMWKALSISNADGFVEQLPKKLDTIVGDRGIRLSGGEKQRIALARALLRKPTLLLLDEAMNALDAENESSIKAALKELHGKLTIIVITHRESSIKDVDHIITLNAPPAN